MADTTTTNTITTATMQPQPKLDIPVAKPDMTPYDSIINGAITSLPSVTGQVDSAQKTTDNLLAGIASTGSDIANKEVYAQGQQDLAGVKQRQAELDALDAQFTDIGAQMKGLVREKSFIPEQVQLANKGTGASDIGVAPQEADALRINTIKSLGLASQADVLSAMYTNSSTRLQRAKDNAQQAVDLKYKPMEAKLAQMKELLDLNQKYILDPAEKKRVEATNIALNERTRLLEEKKATEKTNTDLLINAQTQLAPADVLARAKTIADKGGSTKDVVMALGRYAGEYQQAMALQEQIETSKLNRRKTQAEIDRIRAEISPASNISVGSTGFIAPNGDSVSIPDSTMTAIGKLKLTEGQANAVSYVSRMIQADNMLNKQLGTIKPEGGFYETSGYDPTSAGSALGRLTSSDNSRTYKTNSQDFIRAKLRKESGATISPIEFEGDAKIYTPSGVGLDEKDLLLAKTKRAEAIKSMIAQTGQAGEYLRQYYDQAQKVDNTPVIPTAPNPFQQALGTTPQTAIEGASIVKGASADGTFNFTIPK